jgi:AraC-like DNA-binding protein
MAVWDTVGFGDVAYIVFYATRQGCSEGGVQERGGRFLPESNYVYNIQVDPPRIFAKEHEGKAISQPMTGNLGRYIDAREGSFHVDSASGTVRLRVRFPVEAKAGEWMLRGFVRNESEFASQLFYDRFTLVESAGRSGVSWWWFLILVPVMAGAGWTLFLSMRKKKIPAAGKPSREEEIYQQFVLFVRENVSRELNQEELEKRFFMSYSNLFRIVKKVSGKNIKRVVLESKMEKAQALLRTTAKNVNEVMQEVGFLDPSHFSQVFRKFTGKTPSEFSRQHLQK